MKFIVFTLPLVLVCCVHLSNGFINLADVECGFSKGRSGKIVNGVDATEGEFPWMVSLKLRGEHFCGGVLINKRWILTAAHCVLNRAAAQIKIGIAEHNLVGSENAINTDRKLVGIKKIIMHPNYKTRQVADDIALILLERETEWTEKIKPVCLPNPDKDSFSGTLAIAAGWGWTDEVKNGGRRANTLQKVIVPILENAECQQWYKEEKKSLVIVETCLCAGYKEGGKDSCQGDSGGPLMINKNGRHLVVGVVSAGIGCARPRLPGLYTRVNNYLDWISGTLLNNEF